MPLGTKVGLSPGHIVLDEAQLAPGKRHSSPLFSIHVYCGQTVAHVNYSCVPLWRMKMNKILSSYAVVTCAIYCMQRAAIVACNNCRLSNVFKNIHEAKVLQLMTAFGGIT